MYDFVKRTMDIVGSIFLLLLFSPILFITAVLVKVTSRGPVFADIPNRVGRNGKMFRLYKFRSMIMNAHTLMKTDPRFKELYEKYRSSSYKVAIGQDPRITTVGKFIRRYSIDEMPQLLNVLRGEMSIVGPRAYYPDELEEQQSKYPKAKDLLKEVLTVKPGITGFWQVTGRNTVDFEKRIEMDAYYARKRSLIFDILIILKTPWAMIGGKGAI